MRILKPRIVVTIREGLVDSVSYEGIDLSQVELIKIDYDTEGAYAADGVVMVGAEEAFFSVGDLSKLGEDDAKAVSRAWDAWSVS